MRSSARASVWVLAAPLRGHAIFDNPVGLVLTNPVPGWWAPFCLGIDVVMALGLTAMLWRGHALD